MPPELPAGQHTDFRRWADVLASEHVTLYASDSNSRAGHSPVLRPLHWWVEMTYNYTPDTHSACGEVPQHVWRFIDDARTLDHEWHGEEE